MRFNKVSVWVIYFFGLNLKELFFQLIVVPTSKLTH